MIAAPASPAHTAKELFAEVEAFGLTIEGEQLGFDTEPPEELLPVVLVLHTGIRAVMAGRQWFGCGDSLKTAAPRPLDPARPIPAGVTLLAVEGDTCWDRIAPDARIDHPELFARPAGQQ